MSKVVTFVTNFPSIIWSIFMSLLEWFIPRSWYAKDVSNDIVLVTGAGSGLGREFSLEFAKLGSSLVLWDIDVRGMEKTKELIEAEHKKYQQTSSQNRQASKRFCLTYKVDISKREAIYEAAKKVQHDLNVDNKSKGEEKYVSILINNAGIYYGLYLQELTDFQIENIFQINIISHFWTVRAFLPKMIEHKRGHIVEIASFGGIGGALKQVDYCATKFATVGFEESLSLELDHMNLSDKVRTTAICPYFFKSNLLTGIDRNFIDLSMSSSYVAREAVMSVRCNHSRLFLPYYAYIVYVFLKFSNRQSTFAWNRALGLYQGLKDVRGRALNE